MPKLLGSTLLAASATTCLLLFASAAEAAGFGGPAANYNVFTFGDMTAKWTDAEGRVAIGGNADLSLAVASRLKTPGEENYSLVVGGNLNYRYSQIYQENVAVGGSSSLVGANISQGTLQTAKPIDFDAARTFYSDLSQRLDGLTDNGATTYLSWGGIELNSSASGLNVFALDGAKFSKTNSFDSRRCGEYGDRQRHRGATEVGEFSNVPQWRHQKREHLV
ncbi:MAG: choice-of-anchor A family protein [Synechococcales cyanobacterium RM1_1_8]|nr:choice-of-anchor A family protein [Synechococcales cyanobacterium RM1_1_8]